MHSQNSTSQTSQGNFIANSLPQFNQMGTTLNQHVLPLLALIQEYDNYVTLTTIRTAKIVRAATLMRETDNPAAITLMELRLNDEFPVLDQREKWYKIKTLDNREGWVYEDNIQLISRQLVETRSDLDAKSRQESRLILAQMARYRAKIEELHKAAGELINNIEQSYKGLTSESKQRLNADYYLYLNAKSKIEKYYAYADRFFKPYESLVAEVNVSETGKVDPGERFKGTVSADIGQSRYQNSNSSSTFSKRLAFDGIYQIDKYTRADIKLLHQNELIQTAFLNTTADAGISRQVAGKLVLNGNLGYNKYDDKAVDDNSFGLLRVAASAAFNPGPKTNIFAHAGFQSKSFDQTTLNNYQGILYTLGTTLTPNNNNIIKILVQGNSQTSVTDYLSFNQISPQILYTRKKSPKKSFTLGLDYDQLKFVSGNRFNDFYRYKTEFVWRNNRSKKILSKNLNILYKEYPYNRNQDYFRIGYTSSRRKGSAQDHFSSSSSVSTILTCITQRENMYTTDYFDLRYDKSTIKNRFFTNLNLYNRLWNNFEEGDTTAVDHVLDFYTEMGPNLRNLSNGTIKFNNLKIGFILGGHLFYNFDEEYFNRNGNSLRAGIGINGNFKIRKATLEVAGSYEHSWILVKESYFDPITGEITYGDMLPSRKPQSLQLRGDFRLPVANNWDLQVGLSTYSIMTDATEETSINPVEKKNNLRFSAGLRYRFSL